MNPYAIALGLIKRFQGKEPKKEKKGKKQSAEEAVAELSALRHFNGKGDRSTEAARAVLPQAAGRLEWEGGDQEVGHHEYPNILRGLTFGGSGRPDLHRNPVRMPRLKVKEVPRMNNEGTQLYGRREDGSYGPIFSPEPVDPHMPQISPKLYMDALGKRRRKSRVI